MACSILRNHQMGVNYLSEAVRRKVKRIALFRRDLAYRWVTKRRQFGSPSGHAPRRFATDLTAYSAANPETAKWISVESPTFLRRMAPGGSSAIQQHFSPYLEQKLPEEGVMRFKNARILGGYAGAVVASDETLIVPFSTDPFGMGRHRSSARLKLPKIHDLIGRTAFLATPEADCNYYHFTVDLLPRLLLLERALGSLASLDHLVLNLRNKAYEEPLLRRFGLPLDKVLHLEDDMHLRVEELYVPTFTPSEYGVAAWKTSGIRSKVLKHESKRPAGTKLFLSRKGASSRRLLNEDELFQVLQKHGFVAMDCGAHSLEEQVSIFSSATHVVGLHGAAFTNIIYCQPGTRIYEMINALSLRGFYWSLSDVCGLHHKFITTKPACQSAGLESHRANKTDAEVEIDQLTQAFD